MAFGAILGQSFETSPVLDNYFTKDETLTSSTAALFGLGADAVPDDVLAYLGKYAPKIATGSYVGTGTAGSSNPNSLTFDFDPQLVIITGQYSGSQIAWPLLFMRNNTTAFEMGEGAYTCKVTWNGKIVKWYSTENAGRQMNYDGRKYYYVAIG